MDSRNHNIFRMIDFDQETKKIFLVFMNFWPFFLIIKKIVLFLVDQGVLPPRPKLSDPTTKKTNLFVPSLT